MNEILRNQTDATGLGSAQAHESQVEAQLPLPAQVAIKGFSRFMRRRKNSIGRVNTIESEPDLIDITNLGTDAVAEIAEPEQAELIPTGANFDYLTDLLSPDSMQTYRSSLTTLIASSAELSGYEKISDAQLANSIAFNEAYRKQDADEQHSLNVVRNLLSVQTEAVSSDTQQQYSEIAMKIHQIDKYDSVSIEADAAEARQLINYLSAAIPVQPELTLPAPFANYAENTKESWQAIDETAVQEYLDDRIFVPYSNSPDNGAYDQKFVPSIDLEEGSVILNANKEKAFEVPLNLIVRAAGFDSWHGRNRHGKSWESAYGDGEMNSLDVIKHYAGLPTELPPVSEIRVMIQPDGRILCDNGEGDSHRIAAAILRGDKTIKTTSLSFQRTKQNRLSNFT